MHVDIKKIGEMGEARALKYLKENGWLIAKFGKEIGAKRIKGLSIVHDNFFNIPFGPEKGLFKETSEDDIISEYVNNSTSIEFSFVKANIIVDKYISNFYQKWSDENPLPHNVTALSSDISEAQKEDNRRWMDKFPGKDHPGRYDFVGLIDNKYSALEVKVNSAKLGYWQRLRLELLSKFHVDVRVLRLMTIDGGQSYDVSFEKIKTSNVSESISEEDIIDILLYKPFHIRIQDLKRSGRLTTKDLMAAMKAGLTSKDVLEKYGKN